MRLSERLQQRLRDELGLDPSLPERVERGRHGKAAGTFAWSAHNRAGGAMIGSEDTMAECVRARRLSKRQNARRHFWLIDAEH